MTPYFDQVALENLPQGLRRVGGDGPWMIEQTQYVPALKRRVLWQVVTKLQQGQNAEFVAVRAPLSPALKDLQALREEEQATDEPITYYAYSTAEKILQFVDTTFGQDFPPPHISPDGSGGIRMEWFRGDANVRVVVPREQDPPRRYIYERVNDMGTMKPLSPTEVAKSLTTHIAPR